jgi:flagella basal body P-ring formation protein FlgA
MRARRALLEILFAVAVAAGAGQAVAGWTLDLRESVVVKGFAVHLADLSASSLPSAVGDLQVLGQGDPGSSVVLSRQTILRKLVEAGLARDVSFSGSTEVLVRFEGREVSSESLREEIRRAVQPLVPAGAPGGPASWFELELPAGDLALAGNPVIKVDRNNPLLPGRNQLRIRLQSQGHSQDLPVTVQLHVFGEVPTAKRAIERQTPLEAGLFNWTWLDISEIPRQAVTSREALAGNCAGRSLATGDQLRLNDLKAIPAVNAGDMVDLQIQRGNLVVTVRALARQAGCLGQTIPVRNELNGRLVNARVAGPGLVEWRR